MSVKKTKDVDGDAERVREAERIVDELEACLKGFGSMPDRCQFCASREGIPRYVASLLRLAVVFHGYLQARADKPAIRASGVRL